MAKIQWALDPTHSELGFKIRHLMISNVSGTFKNFHVEAETDNEDFSTVSIRATVDMSSCFTNNEQRDAHLRNADFFEVEKYPALEFIATKVGEAGDSFEIYGNLTMKGVTKPVKLSVEFNGVTKDPWGGQRAGFTVSGKIKRSDWGIHFNSVLETGGLALADEVKINAELQLVKQMVPAAV